MSDQPEYTSIKEVRKLGEKVTTISRQDGIGFGWLVNGVVWKSTGSYFAVRADTAPGGLKRYIRDGGAKYMEEARKILASGG